MFTARRTYIPDVLHQFHAVDSRIWLGESSFEPRGTTFTCCKFSVSSELIQPLMVREVAATETLHVGMEVFRHGCQRKEDVWPLHKVQSLC